MKERLLTGDRPTGPLHLGHFLGSLRNRVKYQESHECYFVIADLHTLTTRPGKEQIARMNQYIHHIVLDYLAAGIDPDRAAIFVQSSVPGIAELSTLLGMLVTAPRLERIPSLNPRRETFFDSLLVFSQRGVLERRRTDDGDKHEMDASGDLGRVDGHDIGCGGMP